MFIGARWEKRYSKCVKANEGEVKATRTKVSLTIYPGGERVFIP